MTTSPAPQAGSVSDAAWKALEGAYDLQVHLGPDVIPRRIDDIDCAREFLAHGLRGFVLKSHYIQTGERAQVVTKAVPGSRIYGAITLNHSVGGLNPVAVEIAGRSVTISLCAELSPGSPAHRCGRCSRSEAFHPAIARESRAARFCARE